VTETAIRQVWRMGAQHRLVTERFGMTRLKRYELT
jgi:hypothetical protein